MTVVRTIALKVPRADWAAIIAGTKTEWRRGGYRSIMFERETTVPPRPVVLYSVQTFKAQVESRLAVLEDFYKEPLGAISPESLAAEGFTSLKEFRRYWREQRDYKSRFDPLSIVNVYCVSPWRDGDRERFGDLLIRQLYGTYL